MVYKSIRITIFLSLVVILISTCAPAAPDPIPTPAPTATPVPEPLTGTIFWDANGSGLQDKTSFIVPEYDPTALPYFFELLVANGTDITAFVEGELVTVPEPTIPGIDVCLNEICTETAADGSFTLQPEKEQNTYHLTFTDPNANDPTKAFRYINKWNGPIVIESYEIDDVTVPEQQLNNTDIIDINQGLTIFDNQEIHLGLMQGFLTLPFWQTQYPNPYIMNYFDIIGIRLYNSKYNFQNTKDNIELNYNGKYSKSTMYVYYPGITPSIGVSDSHGGIDYFIKAGNYILSSSPSSSASWLPIENEELRIHTSFKDPIKPQDTVWNTYGHLSMHLINKTQRLWRGQVIGLSGNTGKYSGSYPQLHFDLYFETSAGNNKTDPFRTILTFDEFPENYWGSEYSYWTVDNIPQYPLVEIVE